MSNDAEKNALRKLTATLQGPVLEIFCQLVPEIRKLPRESAIQTIIDDVDLLHLCLVTFKENRDNFKHLLVDQHRVPVTDAESLLDCGRSLDDILAMVIRTAAKRHFKWELDGVRTPLRLHGQGLVGQRGLLFRIRNMLGKTLETPKVAPQRPRTQGEILYQAFKDYLRYDWQVPLIPDYCQLPVKTVEQLGTNLADQKQAETLVRTGFDPEKFFKEVALINQGLNAAMENVTLTPVPKPEAHRAQREKRQTGGMAKFIEDVTPNTMDLRAKMTQILSADGKALNPAAFTESLLDPNVRNALPPNATRLKITSFLAGIGANGVRVLVTELGLRQDQLVVFLISANLALGDQMFSTAFGVPGRPEIVQKLVQRAQANHITQQSTLTQVAQFVTKNFKRQSA